VIVVSGGVIGRTRLRPQDVGLCKVQACRTHYSELLIRRLALFTHSASAGDYVILCPRIHYCGSTFYACRVDSAKFGILNLMRDLTKR